LAMLHVTTIANVGRPLEPGIEERHSSKISAQETPDSTLTVKASEADLIGAGIGHDQQEANNQTELSTGLANIAPPKVCLSEWVQEVITLEEAVRCMDDDAKKTNS
jgi:hypothetical protein